MLQQSRKYLSMQEVRGFKLSPEKAKILSHKLKFYETYSYKRRSSARHKESCSPTPHVSTHRQAGIEVSGGMCDISCKVCSKSLQTQLMT